MTTSAETALGGLYDRETSLYPRTVLGKGAAERVPFASSSQARGRGSPRQRDTTIVTELRNALNGGVLPAGYYTLGEQHSGDVSLDVLTLHAETAPLRRTSETAPDDTGMIAVAEQPPKVTLTLEAATDAAFYMARRHTLVIYHATGDRILALIEILSPGNKHSRHTVDDFLDKVIAALRQGYHVLVIDLFPPGRCAPSGMHGAIWEYLTNEPWHALPSHPLTLASYCARTPITAYVEPIGISHTLPDMPLFLTPDHYIYVPLEPTYMAAWRGVPQRWRREMEPHNAPNP